MRNASEQALKFAVDELHRQIDGHSDALQIAQQLYGVADLLRGKGSLRRALGDPARCAQDKMDLVRQVLATHVDEATVSVTCQLASQRVSSDEDFATCLDRLGHLAAISSAENATLVSELGGLRSAIASNRDLRVALSPTSYGETKARVELVDTLFAGRVSASAMTLLRRLIQSPRCQSLLVDLDWLAGLASQTQSKRLVRVTSAKALSDSQFQRLQNILQIKYGPVSVNATVDPSMVGGLNVRVAGESIDGSVRSELAAARRQFA